MSARSERPAPFVVTGLRRNGTVTYLCRTPEWALRKLGDFALVGYTGIAAKDPDGRAIDEAALAGLARSRKESEPVAT